MYIIYFKRVGKLFCFEGGTGIIGFDENLLSEVRPLGSYCREMFVDKDIGMKELYRVGQQVKLFCGNNRKGGSQALFW